MMPFHNQRALSAVRALRAVRAKDAAVLLCLFYLGACAAPDQTQQELDRADEVAPTASQDAQQPPPPSALAEQVTLTEQEPLAHSSELTFNSGTGTLRWRSEPAEVPLNEPFNLRVQLPGGPQSIDSLAVDATMPNHRHGMLRAPRITVLGPDDEGSFLVEGMLFHMTGLWELHFDTTRGAVTQRAEVDIILE
ncbi:MAG: hypothetical protein CMJ87_08730 [Planctomycetes bacterium]|jgi:hypothetical protein|nr:hypothetical protein [Planctomycetota bacterium]